ncbi:MAG: acetyl/propionyl/methylcrotonyl-CoA carboxylase subunit alpha [Alphaproteobacteria bacterium]|nr:acetyl/propionyl/methylcrotonyl-CoA carboxylase subunit alpha [Alphaproteobacteria bacterium]
MAKKQIEKILIANRGEIACRVIKTARRLGIKTVAVYSEADATALHVDMADEGYPIGPAPTAESYLVADKIVEVAKATGADAIHPGYGFLSENAGFSERLEKEGITFIGPRPHAINAMGDKIESKRLAKKAGVNTIPGTEDAIHDVDEAVRIAAEIGYPVMIKASAGGGGKGMRVAYSDDEARTGFRSAVNEAKSSFGDDRVFIEKFVEQPRHIEIQVLADEHGNCVYLGERECSIQRRHQKVIEEAPSPFLDAETRKAMGEQAVALSQAVQYRSAGTVEFIVDKNKNFYFLEMNTRLQVEHPVTEYITGLDLVEQMIKVANGEALSFTQDDIKLTGWAMESRVYAEDPERGFLPSIGRMTRYRPPRESETVRVDTGVEEGSEISVFYDPMIAKLITYGPDREASIDAMITALDGFEIEGVGNNLAFLTTLYGMDRFRCGDMSTNYIAEEFPDGFSGATLETTDQHALFALAAALHHRMEQRAVQISGQRTAKEKTAGEDRVVWVDRTAHPAHVEAIEGGVRVTLDGVDYDVIGDLDPAARLFSGTIGGRDMVVQIARPDTRIRLKYRGALVVARVLAPQVAELAALMPEKLPPDMSKYLLSPMPGLLVSVAVKEGDPVKAGQELCVVEAMKMENVLRAEKDGGVKQLHAAPGDSLSVDQIIMEFE